MLTQFGVNLVTLPPGAWSSQRHWHSHEDEFVYVLEGEPGCVLDGRRVTHLKLAPKPGGMAGRCGAELSLFGSEKAWRDTQPDAWGLVERSPCP